MTTGPSHSHYLIRCHQADSQLLILETDKSKQIWTWDPSSSSFSFSCIHQMVTTYSIVGRVASIAIRLFPSRKKSKERCSFSNLTQFMDHVQSSTKACLPTARHLPFVVVNVHASKQIDKQIDKLRARITLSISRCISEIV